MFLSPFEKCLLKQLELPMFIIKEDSDVCIVKITSVINPLHFKLTSGRVEFISLVSIYRASAILQKMKNSVGTYIN